MGKIEFFFPLLFLSAFLIQGLSTLEIKKKKTTVERTVEISWQKRHGYAIAYRHTISFMLRIPLFQECKNREPLQQLRGKKVHNLMAILLKEPPQCMVLSIIFPHSVSKWPLDFLCQN